MLGFSEERIERSDRELVQACQRGDETAWEALVKRYQRLIYTIPRRAGLRPARPFPTGRLPGIIAMPLLLDNLLPRDGEVFLFDMDRVARYVGPQRLHQAFNFSVAKTPWDAAAFRDVTNAGQDRQSAINEANTYRNRVINEAKGTAAQI